MKNIIVPYLRYFALNLKYIFAWFKVKIPFFTKKHQGKVIFIIGCGRSGTTILGRIFEKHPRAIYFFEPWDMWAAVDSALDLTGILFRSTKSILNKSDVSNEARNNFAYSTQTGHSVHGKLDSRSVATRGVLFYS